jgi:hypothetical protein
MDFRYFKRLTPYEFILWNKLKKHEKPNRAPNIYVAIQNFNALNCLVKSEVVMGDKPKSRALVISRWIQTAQVRVCACAVVCVCVRWYACHRIVLNLGRLSGRPVWN